MLAKRDHLLQNRNKVARDGREYMSHPVPVPMSATRRSGLSRGIRG